MKVQKVRSVVGVLDLPRRSRNGRRIYVENTKSYYVYNSSIHAWKIEPKQDNIPTPSSNMKIFKSGATRMETGIPNLQMICPQLVRRIARVCDEGFEKHPLIIAEVELTTGDKGLPMYSIVKHIENHWTLWRSGDRTEDHLAKVGWGIQRLMHTESQVTPNDTSWVEPCEHSKMLLPEENKGEIE